jgi:cytochrome c oxidase cbb3-type subunit III
MTLSTRFARSGQAPSTRPERSRGARSRQVRFWCHAAIVFAILVPRASAAQSADVQAGKTLFNGLCVTCHGFEGTGGAGPPLNRPKLTSAPTDAALRAIISDGIPDRGMPRVRRTTENELKQLVAYVRSLGRTAGAKATGNAQKGRDHYAKLGCAGCHIVNGQGGSFGPALSEIGRLRGADYLRQAILDPGAMLPRGTLPVPARGYQEYLPVRVVMKDGSEVRGVRINEDLFTIQIRDAKGAFHSIRKSNAELVRKEMGVSLMPSFKDRVAGADLDDLVAYLATLGGGQ